MAGDGESVFSSWTVSGTNTVRVERYENYGDSSASPYFSEGTHSYDQLDLSFQGSISPYNRFRGQLDALYNDSDYRSAYHEGMVERMNLQWENGELLIPFRMQAGNFFGNFTPRSLQQSLKGLSLELDPGTGRGDLNHSLLLLCGTHHTDWRFLEDNDDFSSGISYLLSHKKGDSLVFSIVNNHRPSDDALNSLDQDQWIGSLAWEKFIQIGACPLALEGELGYFNGDHNGDTTPADGQATDDSGIFLQLSDHMPDHPLSYRISFERYGKDFQPTGTAIAPNRRILESHAGWRFNSGLHLRGRIVSYRDNLENENYTDTNTVGVNLAGPFWRQQQLSGTLDAFVTESESQDLSTDQLSRTIRLNLYRPIAHGISGRMGGYWQDVNNRPAGTSSQTTKQADFGLTLPIKLGGFTGRISPGIVLRTIAADDGDTWEPGANISANINHGSHNFDIHTGITRQDPDNSRTVDRLSCGMAYGFKTGRHNIGVEMDINDRWPDPGESTEAYRLGLFWTIAFDAEGTAAKTSVPPAVQPGKAGHGDHIISVGTPSLGGLAPRVDLEQLPQLLAQEGFYGGVKLNGYTLFETVVFEKILLRQRLVVEQNDRRVKRVVLLIDFDSPADGRLMQQDFENVMEQLLRQYGTPVNIVDKGAWSTQTLLKDIKKGDFIRIREWNMPQGILRFGIPKRLNSLPRMELHYAPHFGEAHQTHWGLDALP